jgi:hypothetical protein
MSLTYKICCPKKKEYAANNGYNCCANSHCSCHCLVNAKAKIITFIPMAIGRLDSNSENSTDFIHGIFILYLVFMNPLDFIATESWPKRYEQLKKMNRPKIV